MRSARQRRQEKKRRQIYWMCRMGDTLEPVEPDWVWSLSDAELHKKHKLVSHIYIRSRISGDKIIAGCITAEAA